MTQEQTNAQATKEETVNPLKAKLEASKAAAVALVVASEGAVSEALPEEPANKPSAEETVEEPEEKTIPEILAAMKNVSAMPEWTPPKGSFKALKLKQLLLKNRKVKPNEYGYYVVADDKEALSALNYFADLDFGYVERV